MFKRLILGCMAAAVTLVASNTTGFISDTAQLEIEAAGGWNGQDTLFVPISWCIVQGSPAAANPSIQHVEPNNNPPPPFVTDTNTDAVMWRRHERPTDYIFSNQAGISFRSAINNNWGTLNFPIIADPNTAAGVPGDMNGWDVNNDGAEFNTLINNCDAAWSNLGRAGIGVTAVNINLMHDNGNAANDGNANVDYVGIIGWAGCNEFPAGVCISPYDGRVVVIDNNYLYPTVADRTFPPSTADPAGNLQFTNTDFMDVLTGHELGHALSLDHRANNNALMNPGITDNNGDGSADNIALNNAEVNALRANSLIVPGLETDPHGLFDPGNFVADRQIDRTREDTGRVRPFLNLAAVQATLDKQRNIAYLGQQMMGLFPRDLNQPVQLVALVDTDGRPGAPPEVLKELGIPSDFANANLIIQGQVNNGLEVSGRASLYIDGTLIEFPDITFQLHTMVMHPQFADIKGRPLPRIGPVEVYHTLNASWDNGRLPLALGKPFTVQTLVMANGEVIDRLADREPGRVFTLEDPSFPHCAAQDDAIAGGTVKVDFDGLIANQPVHALLGPQLLVENVLADGNGVGTVEMTIPANTPAGLHLITIGTDHTALTADCNLNVSDRTGLVIEPVVVSSEPAVLGSDVQIVVRAREAKELAGIQFLVDYDPSYLQLVTDNVAEGLGSCFSDSNETASLSVAISCSDGQAGTPLNLWELTLNVVGVPPGDGQTDIRVTGVVANDSQVPPQELPAIGETVTLQIVGGTCGDQNGDGVVNVLDGTIDLQIITEIIRPTAIQLFLSDVDRDGDIDIFDVIKMLNHIVGKDQIDGCGPEL